MSEIHKIVHLTSVHPRNDIQFFYKQCISSAKNGFQTYLLVADGKGNEKLGDVDIIDIGVRNSRFKRMLYSTKRIYSLALRLEADLYQIHDPELLPYGLRLKQKGFNVIFDSHEDTGKQILNKPYLNKFTRFLISNLYLHFERYATKKLDAIIGATPSITEKFEKFCKIAVNINNYPLMTELNSYEKKSNSKTHNVVYVGGISENRGFINLLEALNETTSKVRLDLAGNFETHKIENIARNHVCWSKVIYHGNIDRKSVGKLLINSKIGLVTFLPTPNHIEALPNKMFEYMSAGIPVIASAFPIWKRIIDKYRCGICVNPDNFSEIANAINYLIENPIKANNMGINGKKQLKLSLTGQARKKIN